MTNKEMMDRLEKATDCYLMAGTDEQYAIRVRGKDVASAINIDDEVDMDAQCDFVIVG